MQFVDPTVRIASKLRSLIDGVTKSTLVPTMDEVERIVTAFECRRWYLCQLTQAVLSGDHESATQLQLWVSEVNRTVPQPYAIGLFAECLEGRPTVTYNQLQDLLSRAALSRKAHLCFLIGISCAMNDAHKKLGRKMLSERIATEHKGEPEQVMRLLETPDLFLQVIVIALEEPAMAPFAASARSANMIPEALDPVCGISETMESIVGSLSLAGLMEELGPACCSTVTDCQALLTAFPAPLTPRVVAPAVALFAAQPSGKSDPGFYNSFRISMLGLVVDQNGEKAGAGTGWAMPNFVQAIKEAAPNLNWEEVIQSLDFPQCRLEKFLAVLGIFKKATGTPLPIHTVLGTWTNAAAQSQALRTVLNNPDFVTKPTATADGTVPETIQGQLSPFMRHVAFVEALVDCAAIDKDAEQTLLNHVQRAPAVLFAALLKCRPKRSVQHVVHAVSILKQVGLSILTPPLVQYLSQSGCMTEFIGVVCDFMSADATKLREGVAFVVERRLVDQSDLRDYQPQHRCSCTDRWARGRHSEFPSSSCGTCYVPRESLRHQLQTLSCWQRPWSKYVMSCCLTKLLPLP